MSRFHSRQELVDDAMKALSKLTALLDSIPDQSKTIEEVVGGMTVKDFIAHRTEWGRMMLGWYRESRAGGTPAVPSVKYKWNQLRELNAEIHERFANISLEEANTGFATVNAELFALIGSCSEDELFSKGVYAFTGKSDLATYLSSATGGHYRSAYKHINTWWRNQPHAHSQA